MVKVLKMNRPLLSIVIMMNFVVSPSRGGSKALVAMETENSRALREG